MDTSVQDCPFGGKLDGSIVPSCFTLTNFMVFRLAHSPLQFFSLSSVSASSILGSQNPEAYSLASISMSCFNVSSLVLVGRPGRRSLWREEISLESRKR